MSIKRELQEIIKDSTIKSKIEISLEDITIENSKELSNGDFSTNVALSIAKKTNKNPIIIANEIIKNISSSIIERVAISEPGFINIFLTKSRLQQEINKIIKSNKNYGKSSIGKGKKINIEYVSANSIENLHIVDVRGNIYGDNLSRILDFTGYDVTREYYFRDAENQMSNLGISVKEKYKELCGEECDLSSDKYNCKEIEESAEKVYSEFKNKKLIESTDFFIEDGLKALQNQIKKDFDKLRVNFNTFTSEQSLYDTGLVEKTLNTLKKNNECYISENALWLKTSSHGDEKDRVIVTSDGSYTYLLSDISYHINKIDRGYDKLIDVLGVGHHGYINSLKGSIEIMGYDSNILDIKTTKMIRLLKDGEEIKESKRTGKTITLNDLMDEVSVNAIRYFFASKSLDTPMDFDMSLAVKNNNENPVYYIECANAKITKIINSYKKEITFPKEYITFNDKLIYNILSKLVKFEDTVITSSNKKQPYIICNYVYELASLFHTYYANENIITENENYTKERIALLMAIKIVINNSLNLLGIIPREEI